MTTAAKYAPGYFALRREAARRGLAIPGCQTQPRSVAREVATQEERESLAWYVEATTGFELDPWQKHLCERLSRLRYETGQRIAIHAAPQHGKSIIVSRSLPAWMLGHCPLDRVRLACYNITHATRFGKTVRDLMQTVEHRRFFGDDASAVPYTASGAEWSTRARADLLDGQPSFIALGLVSGFTGQGTDLLIIDDPYASPQDAFSEATARSVEMFWNEGARVRTNDNTNIVLMFHRYHTADIAGKLIAEGGWEVLRYAAQAEGDPMHPDLPESRVRGEFLSPRYSREWYEAQKLKLHVWLSQFQGIPTDREGSLYKVGLIEIVDAVPALARRGRGWDQAATAGGGDYTVGFKLAELDGIWYIEDVKRGQWDTDTRNRLMRQTAEIDGQACIIQGEQEPGSGGKDQAQYFIRMLAGFPVQVHPTTSNKPASAEPFSAQVNAGNVKMLRADWNEQVIEELRAFPSPRVPDDISDAAARIFNRMSQHRVARIWG